MKLEFTTNLSELKDDILTISKYAGELKKELEESDIKYSALANFDSIIHAAISHLRYLRDAKHILESSNETHIANMNKLAEENQQLRAINARNDIVIKRFNDLANIYNDNDLDRIIDIIIKEHQELEMFKKIIQNNDVNNAELLRTIAELKAAQTKLEKQLKEKDEEIQKSNDSNTLNRITYAAAGAIASFVVLRNKD